MAEYWESGRKCHGYHELFLNRLLLVLSGGIRNCAEGIIDSAKVIGAYHLERAFVTDLSKLEVMTIEPGFATKQPANEPCQGSIGDQLNLKMAATHSDRS